LRAERILDLEKHCVTILDLDRLTKLAQNGEVVTPVSGVGDAPQSNPPPPSVKLLAYVQKQFDVAKAAAAPCLQPQQQHTLSDLRGNIQASSTEPDAWIGRVRICASRDRQRSSLTAIGCRDERGGGSWPAVPRVTGCVQSEQSGINDFSAKPAEAQTAGPGLGVAREGLPNPPKSRNVARCARASSEYRFASSLGLVSSFSRFCRCCRRRRWFERMFLDSSSISSPMLGRPPSRWRPTGLDGAVFGSLGVFGCTRACLSICSISRPAGTRHWKISQRRLWEPFVAEPLPYFSGGAAGSRDPEADGLPERQHWLACRDPVEPPGTAASTYRLQQGRTQ